MNCYSLKNEPEYDTPWISAPNNGGDVGDMSDIVDELNKLKWERDQMEAALMNDQGEARRNTVMKNKLDAYRSRFFRLVRWFSGPRRRIRELRIDLAAVMRYNIGLANENHRLRTDLDGLGQKLIAEICKQGMFSVRHPDPDESHIFVWAANADEQLECVVSEFLSPNT